MESSRKRLHEWRPWIALVPTAEGFRSKLYRCDLSERCSVMSRELNLTYWPARKNPRWSFTISNSVKPALALEK